MLSLMLHRIRLEDPQNIVFIFEEYISSLKNTFHLWNHFRRELQARCTGVEMLLWTAPNYLIS